MPKVKGRKQRKLRKDRINFLMRLCPRQHQQLKRLAEHRQETIALIIERYLEYMLLGEIARLDREQEQERMAVAVVPNFEAELYQEAYSEVESLVGLAWLKMDYKRRRALAFLTMFPYEAGHRLARMMGMTRQGFQKIKESEVGLKVINHFSDRSLWSKRPQLLRSVVEKAIESENPSWSELALRIFGEYSTKVARVTVAIEDQQAKMPMDLDRELIERAKLLNMTPKRFEQLWANNES